MDQIGWVFWVAAMVFFGILEAATVSMVSAWFVGGSLAALIAQLLGAGWGLQITVFLVVSAVLLACLRPFVHKFVTPKRSATNLDAVIGREAVITEEVNNLLGTGTLKLEGKEWSARSATGEILPVGSVVTITRIEGVKLFVECARAAATV